MAKLSKTVGKYKIPLLVVGAFFVLMYMDIIPTSLGGSTICRDTFGGEGRSVISESECRSGEVYKREGYVKCCMETGESCYKGGVRIPAGETAWDYCCSKVSIRCSGESFLRCAPGVGFNFECPQAPTTTVIYTECYEGGVFVPAGSDAHSYCCSGNSIKCPDESKSRCTPYTCQTGTTQPNYDLGDRVCNLGCFREHDTGGYWDSHDYGCDSDSIRETVSGYNCCCDKPDSGEDCHTGGSKVPDGESVSNYCCEGMGVVCIDGLYCAPHACSVTPTSSTAPPVNLEEKCNADCLERSRGDFYLRAGGCDSGDTKIWTGDGVSCCCGVSGCKVTDTCDSTKCIDRDAYCMNNCGDKERVFERCAISQICENGKCVADVGGGDGDNTIIYIVIAAAMVVIYVAVGGKKRR